MGAKYIDWSLSQELLLQRPSTLEKNTQVISPEIRVNLFSILLSKAAWFMKVTAPLFNISIINMFIKQSWYPSQVVEKVNSLHIWTLVTDLCTFFPNDFFTKKK